MYNLRYHIASLVAVFLALAVGLLLGSVVAEQGMISEQTRAVVDDLERRFDEISATNDQLSVALERDRSFAEAAVGPLVEGRLTGKRVVVFAGTGRVDGLAAVTEAVTEAGGTVVTATLLVPGLGLDSAEPAGLAGYFELRGMQMAQPGNELQRQVAEALVAEWRDASSSELTQLLVAGGLLAVESDPSTTTVDAMIVLGNGDPGCDPFGLEAARAINTAGGIGIGADSAAVEGGVAGICSAQGISSLDHLTTAQGRLTLVWLLSGQARGYYGFGDGAAGSYPPLDS